eukprot:c1172_g1_i2.p1 GENE.c1172_g1_i2~~c1172_g1_i2.p1  ORF type:complete len:368 (+),score=74.56 c1172_g1_i2:29-1105(+)
MSVSVLDVSLFRSPNPADKQRFITELRRVCVIDGVFYVGNHGVPESLCSDLMRVMEEFFTLSDAEKDEIAFIKSPHWRGYAPLGAETTARRQDVREQMEFGLEATCPDSRANPPYLRLQGPNQWPVKVSDPEWTRGFREIVQAYTQELKVLSETLLEALELAVGVEKGEMLKFFQPLPHVRMKLVRYPPMEEALDRDLEATIASFGVGPHKDYGFFGCLLQDTVGGLQYQTNTSGEWVDATPIPGTFVVTLGEMIERLTNGACRATTHRVLVPPRARQSINYFYCPSVEAEVPAFGVCEEMRDLIKERGEEAEKVEFDGESTNVILSLYGENALKGMCRSHPDIVRAHHPDLEHLILG